MMRALRCLPFIVFFWLLVYIGFLTVPAGANPIALSQGQLVYVPVYSHIFFGDRQLPFNLAVTLSLRNVDLNHPIEVLSVGYYDEKGKLLRELISKAITIGPMASTRFFIKESDVSAGSEASFLVRWRASQKVHPPFIGSLMLGASFAQGISFTTSGRVLEEFTEK